MLLRANPAKPIRPDPSSHAAAGTGTAACAKLKPVSLLMAVKSPITAPSDFLVSEVMPPHETVLPRSAEEKEYDVVPSKLDAVVDAEVSARKTTLVSCPKIMSVVRVSRPKFPFPVE